MSSTTTRRRAAAARADHGRGRALLAVVGTARRLRLSHLVRRSERQGAAAGDPRQRRAEQGCAAAGAADPNANKISYDRFGDRGQNEKVVVREEKPVDIKDATRTGPPCPRCRCPVSKLAAAAPTGAQSAERADRAQAGSHRSDPSGCAGHSAARPQMVRRRRRPRRRGSRGRAIQRAARSRQSGSPPQQARAAAVRQTPPPAVPPGARAGSANAPLSLAPETPRCRRPAPRVPRAAPTARGAGSGCSGRAGNGSYLVQVSSQRSEADAQAAFRSIKSKYSSVLGDRQPVIRRADLAGKGTYYRAMVGPFATRDQAIQLCSSLKSAGGDCVVQAN